MVQYSSDKILNQRGFYNGEKNYSKVPVFENGLAQPVFKFTDGKTGENYDPATSSIVRYCVYVESDYDMDGDGKRDLVKAFIQVPRSAVEAVIRRQHYMKHVRIVQECRQTDMII